MIEDKKFRKGAKRKRKERLHKKTNEIEDSNRK